MALGRDAWWSVAAKLGEVGETMLPNAARDAIASLNSVAASRAVLLTRLVGTDTTDTITNLALIALAEGSGQHVFTYRRGQPAGSADACNPIRSSPARALTSSKLRCEFRIVVTSSRAST